MCLILLAIESHPRFPLVIAANRDEFHDRPSLPAAFWHENEQVWGGRDLRSGGSWLAVTRAGRLAMVTNVREGIRETRGYSRGELVRRFALSDLDPADWLGERRAEAGDYPGFNLIVGVCVGDLCYWSNRGRVTPERILPGVHGLSNGRLDASWPKVRRGRDGMARLLSEAEGPDALTDGLLGLMADRTPAADADLPATGVPLAWERLLAPMFVRSPEYGTRCSTVLLFETGGLLHLCERRYDPDGETTGESRETVCIS
ncbi:MAG: NRDE family protein [Geothermobacteraceae bacterium]